MQRAMEPARSTELAPKQLRREPQPDRGDRLRRSPESGKLQDMARKKLIVLDPDNSFELASRHLYRCRKCKNAGMEWARRKDLCRRGRQLLQDLDRVERIYEAVERAA